MKQKPEVNKNRQKISLLIIVSFILVVLILSGVYERYGGCVTYIGGFVGIDTSCTHTFQCQAYLLNTTKRDYCYFQLAVDQNNPTLCRKLSKEFSQSGCFSNIALSLKDPQLCLHITDNDHRQRCINQIEMTE